jgi:hypothetical protein
MAGRRAVRVRTALRRVGPSVFVLLGLASMVGGGLLAAGARPPVAVGTVPPALRAPVSRPGFEQVQGLPPAAAPLAGGTPAPDRRRPFPPGTPGAIPIRLRVPGQLDAPVTPVDARDGALQVPARPFTLGWWSLGGAPGAGAGTVLIAGHVDSARYGLGAFAALGHTPIGARAELTGLDGQRYAYRVVARRAYPRSELPADLFSAGGAPRLALITCAGSYDRRAHRYAKNLVLYAIPTGR